MNLEDYSKAVSFTNSYCALADGLVSGLGNCLAENVVLDWFGKTIQNKNNVTAFMNTHKVNSRHIFNKITPTTNIGYNKRSNCRRVRHRSINPCKRSNNNITIELQLNESTPINEIVSCGDRSRSSSKIGVEENHIEESDINLDLNDDDLSKIFKLEKVKSTNIEEIEQLINQISLEEKTKFVSPRKRDYKEIDNFGNHDPSKTMNFVEAHGEIIFSKKLRRLSGWNEKMSTLSHSWHRPCKLQIAYTSKIYMKQASFVNNNLVQSDKTSHNSELQQKLLNFDDINEISNRLVPNKDNFGGYLRNINLIEEDNIFFKNLNEHLSKNEANKLGLTSRYINNQLVFEKQNGNEHNDFQNEFIFNHLIHVIIYESKSRCRMNLSQKFK